MQVYFEGTFVNARNGEMLEFMGSEATLYLDRGRYEIHPERNKKIESSELVLGSGPRGADFYDLPKGEVLHLTNWLECVRSRQKPNAPAEAGVSAAAPRTWPTSRCAAVQSRSGKTDMPWQHTSASPVAAKARRAQRAKYGCGKPSVAANASLNRPTYPALSASTSNSARA